jgi:ATP-dependent Clp protease ATP-binding subunit ClpC
MPMRLRRRCRGRSGSEVFEAYNDEAKRAIFFARYEAAEEYSPVITTRHIVLGILRERSAFASRMLNLTREQRKQIRKLMEEPEGESIPPPVVDLPLDDSSKRALAYTAEEVRDLGSEHIGSEHLLLGILREDKEIAKELEPFAIGIEEIRNKIRDGTVSSQPRDPDQAKAALKEFNRKAKPVNRNTWVLLAILLAIVAGLVFLTQSGH